uniref:Oxidation resistance protein 1 n=2 Tax=Anthurium amnicola TaxID=1678845 RepID=A0A1D1ZKQ5_9ARAE
MGHKKPSLRSKAAHLVSDITTVILNPISDEPSTPRGDGSVMEGREAEISETESNVLDGPDTSSFTAFLISLLSSAESNGHSNEESEESHVKMGEMVSSSGINENAGRKGLITRGKQSLGRVLQKASRISGHRDKRFDQKAECDLLNAPNSSSHELMPMNVPKNTAPEINLPIISEPSLLLSENMRSDLYVSLPAVTQGKNWVLLYSTWRHGISLSTLYRRSMLCPGLCLLVVGDRMGAVFGGLVEAPLCPTNKRKYQGTNSTFVFTIISSHPVIFRPTGANHYFTLCSTDYFALGGGGHFALYLDGDLLNGSSSSSETFGNTCLAHSQDFEVKEVELWGFVYASKYEETMALCRTEATGICRW